MTSKHDPMVIWVEDTLYRTIRLRCESGEHDFIEGEAPFMMVCRWCGENQNEVIKSGWTLANCSECNKTFKVRKRRKSLARELFCSIDCCRTRWDRTHITRVCENCHKEFTRPQSVKQTRFCCWACYREFQPPHAHGANFGHFISNKGAGVVHFDSSWELTRMKEFESDKSIISWRRSEHRIPWVDVDGTKRTYFPDFDVFYRDGRIVIEEVKGYVNESTQLKLSAGKKYADALNLEFRILNDRDFKPVAVTYEQYDNDFGSWSRPTFESVFMGIAQTMSSRSTCIRLQVGAIFVDPGFTRVLSFGYNGGVSGDENQCESLEAGACGCIHAEVNAMMKATEPLNGSILFVTTMPCKACAKLLIARGVGKVIYSQKYRDRTGVNLLKKHKIPTISWSSYVKSCDEAWFKNQFNEKLVKPQIPMDDSET